MKLGTLDVLACPRCHAGLESRADGQRHPVTAGSLTCLGCGRTYVIVARIPRFIEPANLTGLNRRFSRLYDWFAPFYGLYTGAAFAVIGGEARCRRDLIDRLAPRGRVLEVSIGTGSNLPYLMDRPDVASVFGLDISPGQLRQCQRRLARHGWQVELLLGDAEELPFHDAAFDAVLHAGGINFFNDRRRAIDEMLRVARPGAKIVIADENKRGARLYDVTLPGFRRGFGGERQRVAAPAHLVPATVEALELHDLWGGWFYCLEFRKPEREPVAAMGDPR